ncbi:ATP-binding cassette domain-containing protein [uncultured Thiohalocapsa sp.]|uniref:ATP-binding cassette domain-containing protein n=1 Tax=uncultured Thiohalocapsa sp. TaxID=768990 RepID=UPI0025FE95F5|nr:ATP-binding cassette domain-containing protein [uncultured Thiohalocapsa sp.]
MPIGLAILLVGAGEALLLALINMAAEGVYQGEEHWLLALAFVGVYGATAAAQWLALSRSSDAVEQAITGIKVRAAEKLRRSSLRFVEQQGGIDAYAPLTRIGVISQGTVLLVVAAQAVSVLVFVFIYLALLSPAGLVAIVAILAVTVPVLGAGYAGTRPLLQRASAVEGRFFHRFGELISGFSDVVMDRRLSDGLLADLGRSSRESLDVKLAATERHVRDINFASSMLSLLMFAVMFAVPLTLGQGGGMSHELATAVLFLFGPVGELAAAIPVLGRFDAAVSDLYALEDRLDRASAATDGLPPAVGPGGFERIELDGVGFHYGIGDGALGDASVGDGQSTFAVGPLDLTLRRGELVFIVGGNGSGKSTLLKLLTGLYRPAAGRVLLDGEAVADDTRPAYRTLFATVFTDFHLFERLHGQPEVAPAAVNERLAELGLAGKTRYTADGFTDLALSTGQRKRIALLAALGKERPILVLDELPADQDPPFRRRFYEEMLPALKAQGMTLVCVTHDDHYFHVADRVLRMRDGRLFEQERGGVVGGRA